MRYDSEPHQTFLTEQPNDFDLSNNALEVVVFPLPSVPIRQTKICLFFFKFLSPIYRLSALAI